MKRLSKILFTIIMIIPIYIYALEYLDYNSSYSKASSYITKGNYASTYQRYIKSTSESHFVSREEFELTKNPNGVSFLFDGVEYWTSVGSDNLYYIVNYHGNTQVVNSSDNYKAKDVEYVNEESNGERILVRGSGSYDNPWTFEPMYEVKVITNEKYGYITYNGGNYTTLSKYIVKGNEAKFSISAKDKYMYITNDCGARYLNGELIIDNVRRNLTCKVVFGTGRYKITLNGSSPSTIYAKYKDNFYSDSDCKNVITQVNVSTPQGYTFEGFKYNGITIIDASGKINRVSANSITEDLTLNPTYTVQSPSVPTISGGTTKVHNYENTTLTCSSSGSYASGTNIYYEFGYATSTTNFNNNVINWLGSPSTTSSYTVSKSSFVGTRYYTCRSYASNGTYSSNTVKSSSYTTMSLVHPRIDFDANGGTISGSTPLYSSYNSDILYTTRTDATVASKPTATKTGYTFNGWYTTSGTKVINADGTLVGSVSNWTNANKKFILTNLTDTANTNKLVAQYTGIQIKVTFNANGGTGLTSTEKYVTYGSTYGTLPTIDSSTVCEQMRFVGWYTAPSGGDPVTSTTTVTSLSNHTLYAHRVSNGSCCYVSYYCPKGGSKVYRNGQYWCTGSDGSEFFGVGGTRTCIDGSWVQTANGTNQYCSTSGTPVNSSQNSNYTKTPLAYAPYWCTFYPDEPSCSPNGSTYTTHCSAYCKWDGDYLATAQEVCN